VKTIFKKKSRPYWAIKIKTELDRRGITQKEWADANGIAPPTLSAVLKGRLIRESVKIKICQDLGIKI
jgi:gp16 family phage-associated protein